MHQVLMLAPMPRMWYGASDICVEQEEEEEEDSPDDGNGNNVSDKMDKCHALAENKVEPDEELKEQPQL